MIRRSAKPETRVGKKYGYNDTYSPSKHRNNREFAKVAKANGGPIFYLDSVNARTTSVVLEEGISPEMCYVADREKSVVDILRMKDFGIDIRHEDIQNYEHPTAFTTVYLDLMGYMPMMIMPFVQELHEKKSLDNPNFAMFMTIKGSRFRWQAFRPFQYKTRKRISSQKDVIKFYEDKFAIFGLKIEFCRIYGNNMAFLKFTT